MNIGKLDRLITLLSPDVVAQNAFGQPAPQTWTAQGAVWAQVKLAQGSEAVEADQKTATQPVTFTIRYQEGVLPTWRVAHDNQLYHLTAVAEIGRRVGLTLTGFTRGEEPGI